MVMYKIDGGGVQKSFSRTDPEIEHNYRPELFALNCMFSSQHLVK